MQERVNPFLANVLILSPPKTPQKLAPAWRNPWFHSNEKNLSNQKKHGFSSQKNLTSLKRTMNQEENVFHSPKCSFNWKKNSFPVDEILGPTLWNSSFQLKFVSAIFYQIFIYHQIIARQKIWKMFIYEHKMFLDEKYFI